MKDQRLQKLEELFQIACELAPDERPAFYERHCAGDDGLRGELEELLGQQDQGTREFLRSPVLGDAERAAAGGSTHVGPYRVLEKIGEGGMGVVYLAEEEGALRRRVAMKLVKPGLDLPRVLARFEAERATLARLEHPGIARIYDAGTFENGRPYFAMEYIPGPPITAWCDGRRLGLAARLELFAEVCDAVQHAHQKGIVHRDLKPSNVLVCEDGGRAVPKVIDFGIARAIAEPMRVDGAQTQQGEIVGSGHYMSPEQADPMLGDVDTRTDVYSLGALLYELLVGVPPFDVALFSNSSFLEVQQILRDRDPETPSHRWRSLGPGAAAIAAARGAAPGVVAKRLRGDLDWITMKALERERGRRYSTVAELAADVRRFLAGDLVEAGPPSAAYRLRKFVKRNRLAVISAAGIALSLVTGIIFTTWAMFEAREAEERAHVDYVSTIEVATFLADALSLSYPQASLGPGMEHRRVLDRASARLEEGVLEGNERGELLVRRALGEAYHRLGELGPAERHLQRSRELTAEMDLALEERYGALHALSLVYLDSDSPASIDLFFEAELILLRLLRESYPTLGRRLERVLEVNDELGWKELPDLIDAARRTADESVPPGDESWLRLADVFNAEGVFAMGFGGSAVAVQLLDQSLDLRRSARPEAGLEIAREMLLLADACNRAGQFEKANEVLVEALEVLGGLLAEDHWLLAKARSLLGESHLGLEDYE